jgi:hypothetical protein
MALVGKVTLYDWVQDMDTPITENIVKPDGTETTITSYPMKELAGEVIEDAYVIIRMAAIHLDDNDRIVEEVDDEGNIIGEFTNPAERGETKNGYKLNLRYNIYDSKENRQDRFFKPIYEIDEIEWIVVDDLGLGGKNLIEFCYDYIKSKQGFEELVND